MGVPAPALTIKPDGEEKPLWWLQVLFWARLALVPCGPPLPWSAFAVAVPQSLAGSQLVILLGNLRLLYLMSWRSRALSSFWGTRRRNARLMSIHASSWEMDHVSLLPLLCCCRAKLRLAAHSHRHAGVHKALFYYLRLLVKVTPGPLASRLCLCPRLFSLLCAIQSAFSLPLPAAPVISALPLGSFSR